jgi:hypothetical protein
MSSRQARKQRRELERKAKKAAYKAARTTSAPLISLEEEFSPELIAEAQTVRERVARRVAAQRGDKPPVTEFGFVPQNEPSAQKSRAEINRANAAHSTGPVGAAGKLASSRNSLKHGLASGQLIMPGEDAGAFEALLESLIDDHQPANPTEEILVHEMAQSWWLTRRALRLQNDCFAAEGVDEKRLALFLRYQTTHERAFHKALNTLLRLQKDRRHARAYEIGFVSQHRAPTGSGAVCPRPHCAHALRAS